MMKIDAHSHFLPESLIEFIQKDGKRLNTEIVTKDGKQYVKHAEGFMYPLFPEFYEIETKISDLNKMGLDQAVLSVPPTIFYYWVESDLALQTSQICNDWVSALSRSDSEHFRGMATVPMQDIPKALMELERAHERLALNAVEIGSVINDKNLDEKEFFPIYEYCESNDILIALHPYYIQEKQQYARYYNTNLSFSVFETTMAINSLIFGGVFEQFPKLKVLAAHGGGYFPYQLGRLIHGYEARPEPKVNITKSPENYLGGVYFDTITHWVPSLQFLSNHFGADHIVIGTDYPFDMGDYDPISKVDALKITNEERKSIYSENILTRLCL